ncbi:IPT/TIG domain-containing protein [Pontibacter sp. 13R65]|uniref:IPT/TIG domain-containing protein n=1 Tax=Pontibacter sp. 13R65 TaxID=3127458 RepID=UPI00301DCA68
MISDTLTVSGQNFSQNRSENHVTIHGIPVPIVAASTKELKVVVPDGVPFAYVDLVVSRNNHQPASSSISINEYPSPEITGISPTNGSAGTVVTIYGRQLDKTVHASYILGFTGANGEMLHKPAYPFIMTSADSVQVAIPSDAGTGPIYLPVWPNQSIENTFVFLSTPVFTIVP